MEESVKQLDLGRFWTAPNILSISRAVVVIPIMYLIMTQGPISWLAGCVLWGIASDWLDGQVARWTNTVSGWGKVLDPLADKVAAIGIVFALVWVGAVPLWLMVIVAARDLLIVSGGILLSRKIGEVAMSIWTGKVAVTVLSLMVLSAILKVHPAITLIYTQTAAALFIYSFFLYALRVWGYVRTGKDATFGQLLDAYANEITVALLATFMYLSPAQQFEALLPAFMWLSWACVMTCILFGWNAFKRRQRIFYPNVLHLPVATTFLYALYLMLEPDAEVVRYGQWLILGLMAYAYFLFIIASFWRYKPLEYIQKTVPPTQEPSTKHD
ncbi:MAG: CDP-alcohol phosphatidyltransferase family protein [Bacteroidetes Order II. Incertae sedis bacterium]|nr:CDP-alcohol phosphatidyltransferase family protein [Bacteroidetes Order II. bacterium]